MDGQKKGSRGQYDKYAGTCGVLNENTPFAARSSSVAGETNTRDEDSLSLVVVKLPHCS